MVRPKPNRVLKLRADGWQLPMEIVNELYFLKSETTLDESRHGLRRHWLCDVSSCAAAQRLNGSVSSTWVISGRASRCVLAWCATLPSGRAGPFGGRLYGIRGVPRLK